jgi:hypothetical protein
VRGFHDARGSFGSLGGTQNGRFLTMSSLVAFVDILGTREMSRRNEFSELHALDFANPLGIMARHRTTFRTAAFSDSAIISVDEAEASVFVGVLSYLFTQWFADHVFVRGGIALGEINWVEQPSVDAMFRSLHNFQFARVYGGALTEAVELERASGPWAICFVSEDAAGVLRTANDSSVLSGISDMLVWSSASEADRLERLFTSLCGQDTDSLARRHHLATARYFRYMIRERTFLETEPGYRCPDGSWTTMSAQPAAAPDGRR